MRKGIDVSVYQGVIDYTKARDDIDFVIPRVSYSTNIDTMFRRNVQKALENGVAVPAMYLFSYAFTTADAVREANFAISEAEIAKLPKSTIIFYDFEYDSINYAKRNGVEISNADINNFATAFCETCIQSGYNAGIYLNQDFYVYKYTKDVRERYPIWLADWRDTTTPAYPCTIHQYGVRDNIKGIHGEVDVDYIYDCSLAQVFETESGGVTVEPPKSDAEVAKEVIQGKWGVGADRKQKLIEAGYSYEKVQSIVNSMMSGTYVEAPVVILDKDKCGEYKTTASTSLINAKGTSIYNLQEDVTVYSLGLTQTIDKNKCLHVTYLSDVTSEIVTGFCPVGTLKFVQKM